MLFSYFLFAVPNRLDQHIGVKLLSGKEGCQILKWRRHQRTVAEASGRALGFKKLLGGYEDLTKDRSVRRAALFL